MFRNFAVRALLLLVTVLIRPAGAQVTAWDAARDFSGAQNPNAQWSYGWKVSPSASLTPFTTYEQTLAAYPGRDAWQDLSRSSLLGVYHNSVGVTGDIPTNMLMLQPDPLGELATLEWTAPSNMSIHLQGMFQTLDTAASQVTIVSSVSGTRFTATVNSGATTSSFGLFLNVAAGEKIDFVASGGAAGINAAVSKLSIVGNGSIQDLSATDTRLRLNSNAQGQVGGAWTFAKQRFLDGFDTSFLFQISQLNGPGADGFAFVIQNSATSALGGNGGFLGYDSIPASLAVEFDTFQNTQPGWNDPNGNHISVHTLGINPNSAMETASIGSTTSIPNLKDGQWHVVHVNYAVQPQPKLSIYIDNLTTPVLQIAVDIVSKLQLPDGTAWVGFTGATGGFTEVHDIQNWHFVSSDLHPPLLSLPSNMALEGNTVGGAAVTFTASALDAVDGPRPVSCTPGSGTVFPVGNTTVTCSSTDLSRNSASGTFIVTVTDTVPPSITVPLAVDAAAVNASGATVSYIATAADIVDGPLVPTCSPASGSIFPLGKTLVTCSATDHAGNSASGQFSVNVTDQTPPAIAGLADLQVEATATLTAVSWPLPAATDNVDGNVVVMCTPASGTQFPLGSTTVHCSATDAAGNQASGTFSITIRDTTPPTISGVPANMTLEATGPSGAAATWPMPTAVDLVDGAVPVTCLPASGSMFPLGSTTVACSAVDSHGHKTTKSFSVKVQDTTAPVISCGKPDGLWHASDVSITCTARDSGSDLASAADAQFVLTTAVAAGIETPNAATNTHIVCDLAGNCVTAGPITGNAVDKRSPTITITAPSNGVYALHQPVTASYSCSDGGSGIGSCNGSVASGAPIDTGSVGAKQLTVNASDSVGNLATASINYNVGYNLCLLDGHEPKQSGSTIPIRFALCDYLGKNVSSPSLPVFATAVVGPTGAVMPARAAGDSNPGLMFRFTGDRGTGAYMFNLKTEGLTPGTYQLLVRVGGDSSPHQVLVQIREKGRD
ncbi:MAG: HYR domain-containing protein [Terriglobales bacterium]